MLFRIILSTLVGLLLTHPLLAQPPFLQNRWANQAIADANYPKAILHSVESLKHWPGNKKATANLKVAYAPMTGDFEQKRSQLAAITDTLVGDETVQQCQRLVTLYDSTIAAINAVGGLNQAERNQVGFVATDYRSDRDSTFKHLVELKHEAAQMHAEQAAWLMEQGSMEACRSAYHELTLALKYEPDNADLQAQRDLALTCGTKRVMVMPFSVNATVLRLPSLQTQSGDLGRQAAASFSQRVAQQDLIFVEMVSVDEVVAEMTAQGYKLGTVPPQEALLQVGQQLEVDEIWMGTVNSVVAEEPQTQVNREREFSRTVTRKEKKPREDKDKNGKVTTVYEEVPVKETITATYDEYNQTAATVVQGTYWTLDVASGQRSEAKPYQERRSYDSTWAQYTGGSKAAWAKFSGSQQNTIPSLSQRLMGGFQVVGSSLSNSFRAEDKRMAVPVIHNKMELKSRPTD
jgi:hypothetical protein